MWPEAIFQASILPPTRGPASPLFLLQGQHTPFPLPEVLLLPSVSNRIFSHPLASAVKTSQNFLPRKATSSERPPLRRFAHQKASFQNIDSEDCSPQEFFFLRKSLFKKISFIEEHLTGKASLEGLFKNGYLLMPSPESLLGEDRLLLRRPRQKGLLRGFSQNVLLSERSLLCAFSSEMASSSEKAASSSASSFFLLRRTSHQERFLSARLSLQEFSGKLDLRSLPLRGSPFQKHLLHKRLPSQEHLYRCSVFRFLVTFCSYLFARICFFFLLFLSDNLSTYIFLSRQRS